MRTKNINYLPKYKNFIKTHTESQSICLVGFVKYFAVSSISINIKNRYII